MHFFIYTTGHPYYSSYMDRLNGELITGFMQKSGMSYGGMAAELGVSPSLLRQMEQGYLPRKGRESILSRLAAILGVSAATLTLRSEAKTA